MSDELKKKIAELQNENKLLFSGLAACIIASGKDELFIPDNTLGKCLKVEMFRDQAKPFGYVVKVQQFDIT